MLVAPTHTASYPKAYKARNAQADSRCAPPTPALELLLLPTKLAASGEIGRRVTGKRWKERIRGSTRGGFHTYAGGRAGGGRKVGSEKEDLPRGKVRWREREETIDRGGGGARAGTTTATTG